MPNQSTKSVSKAVPKSQPIIKLSSDKPNKLRSSSAFILATLALFFASLAIFSFWIERTLTDTDKFVEIVGPLAEKEEVQKLISRELSETIEQEVTQTELATNLLNTPVGTRLTPVLESQLDQKIDTTVDKVLSSEQFEKIWTGLIKSAHTQVIKILEADEGATIAQINVAPQLQQLIDLVNKNEFKLSEDIKLTEDSGVIALDSQMLKDARQAYSKFVSVDTTAIVLGILFAGLAILVANNRLRMVRRLAIGMAVSSGLTALLILVISKVKLGNDETVANFINTISGAVFSGLSKMMITIFIASLVVTLVTSLVIRRSAKA